MLVMITEDALGQPEAPLGEPQTRRARRWLSRAAIGMVAVSVLGVIALQIFGERVGPVESNINFRGLSTEPGPEDLTIEVVGGGGGCLIEVVDKLVQESGDEVRISAVARTDHFCSYSTRVTFELQQPLGARRIVDGDGRPLEFSESLNEFFE